MQLSKKLLILPVLASVAVAACGSSQAQPLETGDRTVYVQQETVSVPKSARATELLELSTSQVVPKLYQAAARKKPADLKPPCGNYLVKWIWEAGFRGQEIRVAWAIAQRESNGNPKESSWPDLGLMQLNAPTWQGTKYWPDDVYDPIQNLTAVKKMVKDKGWQPWGLRVHKGKVSYDFSSYGMWSSWHHQNWIVIPFERYYSQFPKKCARNL